MSGWSETQFSTLNTALKDTTHYGSVSELRSILGEDFILPEQLENQLNDYYTETAQEVQKTATAQLKSLKTSDSKNAQYY